MNHCENPFLPDFSHIYVESGAFNFELTNQCISKYSNATIIEISDYKSFFNRPNQDFQTQKISTKLILALKKQPFIYKGTDILQDGGYKNFYYNTPILNCLYNCSYCFLQGMYPSANIVVFVNEDDMRAVAGSNASVLWPDSGDDLFDFDKGETVPVGTGIVKGKVNDGGTTYENPHTVENEGATAETEVVVIVWCCMMFS